MNTGCSQEPTTTRVNDKLKHFKQREMLTWQLISETIYYTQYRNNHEDTTDMVNS